MLTRQPRKKKLRDPFVATVAVAAGLLPACGGGIDSGVGGTNPPPNVSDAGDSGDARPPTNPLCPADPPSGPCTGVITCQYGDCYGSPMTTQCDPKTGQWLASTSSCNPPAIQTCPPTEPLAGSACSATSGPCAYVDACGDGGAATFTCNAGRWATTAGPAQCPATLPAAGTSCAACSGRWPSQCEYPDINCFDQPPWIAQCDAQGQWQVAVPACNPPGDAGPLEAGPFDAGAAD